MKVRGLLHSMYVRQTGPYCRPCTYPHKEFGGQKPSPAVKLERPPYTPFTHRFSRATPSLPSGRRPRLREGFCHGHPKVIIAPRRFWRQSQSLVDRLLCFTTRAASDVNFDPTQMRHAYGATELRPLHCERAQRAPHCGRDMSMYIGLYVGPTRSRLVFDAYRRRGTQLDMCYLL